MFKYILIWVTFSIGFTCIAEETTTATWRKNKSGNWFTYLGEPNSDDTTRITVTKKGTVLHYKAETLCFEGSRSARFQKKSESGLHHKEKLQVVERSTHLNDGSFLRTFRRITNTVCAFIHMH